MACKELPTLPGAVVKWGFYYDGPNHRAATLTFDRIFEKDADGNYVYEKDPDWPAGYGEGEEADEIVKVRYEGLVWEETGSQHQYTPAEFAERHRIDHDWWEKYQPEHAPSREVNFNVTILHPGAERKPR